MTRLVDFSVFRDFLWFMFGLVLQRSLVLVTLKYCFIRENGGEGEAVIQKSRSGLWSFGGHMAGPASP